MKWWLLSLCLLAACAEADVERLMQGYWWEKRVLVVLSPSEAHSSFQVQAQMIAANKAGFKDRDVVVYEIVHNQAVRVDGEHQVQFGTPPFYDYFQADPRDFTVILLGKDGEEKHRQNEPLDAERLFGLIDAMPMRQREMELK